MAAAQQDREPSLSHSHYEHYPGKIPEYFADIYMDKYIPTSVRERFAGLEPTFNHSTGTFIDGVADHTPSSQKQSDRTDDGGRASVMKGSINSSLNIGTARYPSQEQQDTSALYASANIMRSLTPQPKSSLTLNKTRRPSDPQPTTVITTVALIQVTPEMRTQAKAFRNAVAAFEKTTNKKELTDLMNRHITFESLLQDIKSLQEAYQDGESTVSNTIGLKKKVVDAKPSFGTRVRLVFRSMEKAAPGVNAWLQLLPSDSWGASVIVGGLRVVFKAAEILNDIGEMTYDVLARIPESLSSAQRLCKLYSNSPKIQSSTSDLYVTVLKALGHMMTFYTTCRASHALGSIFKSNNYEQQMKECFRKLEINEKTIFSEADTQLHMRVHGIESQQLDMYLLMQDLKQDQTQHVLLAYGGIQAILRSGEKTQLLLLEDRKKELDAKAHKQRQRSAENDRRKNWMLERIGYNPDQIGETRLAVLNQCITLPRVEQGYAMSMLDSPNVLQWINEPRSSTLVINAGQNSQSQISSASLASYLLGRNFDEPNDVVVMRWFCGLCTGDHAVENMVTGMVGQLLDSNSFAVDLVKNWPVSLEKVSNGADNFKHLLQAFHDLLGLQLSHSRTYIIIDGASFYDTWRLRNQFSGVLDVIAGVAEDQGVTQRMACKLLLTSPFSMGNLADGMPGLDILDLSPNRYQDTSYLHPGDLLDSPRAK